MRATAFWNEDNTQLIENQFVAVAVNGMSMNNRKDSDKEFLYDICKLRLAGAGGNIICVTASGKQLGGNNGVGSDLQKAWKEWQALPEAERKPGAVKVPEPGPVDPVAGPAEPPPGCLILKQYYRVLAREKEKLRYVKPDDMPSGHWSLKGTYWYEAAPDFMWLTEAEWKSLIPDQPKQGKTFPMPEAITERLFQFHLVPTMAFGESNGWGSQKTYRRSGEVTLTVEEITTTSFRLRLEGFAKLGEVYDAEAARERAWHKSGGVGYEPRLLGYLEYDQRKKAFTRFDLVALGDTYGTLGGDLRYFYRPGRVPLGIAFELVDPKVPANRVPPLGLRKRELEQLGYLGKAR